jgi:hypothetical protein
MLTSQEALTLQEALQMQVQEQLRWLWWCQEEVAGQVRKAQEVRGMRALEAALLQEALLQWRASPQLLKALERAEAKHDHGTASCLKGNSKFVSRSQKKPRNILKNDRP